MRKKLLFFGVGILASIVCLGITTGGFPSILTLTSTGLFYSSSGAHVQRLNDRVFMGDAAANDGANPNAVQDWLSAFQTGVGIPAGSITGSQTAILTTSGAAAVTAPIAQTVGCRTSNVLSSNQNCIGAQSFAVNNSASFTPSVWGYYSEAHRFNNVVGSAIGAEYDVTQRGAQVGITPYAQNFGQTAALQLASGAQQGITATATFATNVMTITTTNIGSDNGGILVGYRVSCVGCPANTTIPSFGTGTGGNGNAGASANGTYNLSTTPGTLSSRLVAISPMFDNTAAINIQANPNSFMTGINFGSNSIAGTDGVNGVPSSAIQLGRLHAINWFAGVGTGIGGIYGNATATAGSTNIQLGQGSVQFIENSTGAVQVQFNSIAGNVNYPALSSGATGNPASIAAVGSDANINVSLAPKGTGTVQALGPVQLMNYTVATLPACTAANHYSMAAVTDAVAPAYNAALTGGGAINIPVFCTGSSWTAH